MNPPSRVCAESFTEMQHHDPDLDYRLHRVIVTKAYEAVHTIQHSLVWPRMPLVSYDPRSLRIQVSSRAHPPPVVLVTILHRERSHPNQQPNHHKPRQQANDPVKVHPPLATTHDPRHFLVVCNRDEWSDLCWEWYSLVVDNGTIG